MIIAPVRGRILVGATWKGQGLVEAEAVYVGGLDYVGVIVVLFGECDGEVLYAMGRADFHQILDEVFEVFDVVVVSFVGFDVSQEDYVVRKIEHTIGLGQNDNCGGECRVVRVKTNAIAVLLVDQSGRLSAEVVSEIVLYIGECISHTLFGVWLIFFVL